MIDRYPTAIFNVRSAAAPQLEYGESGLRARPAQVR